MHLGGHDGHWSTHRGWQVATGGNPGRAPARLERRGAGCNYTGREQLTVARSGQTGRSARRPPEIAPAPAAQPAGIPRQGAGQADSKAESGAKLLRAEPQVTMCAGSARRQRTGEAQRGDATAAAADTVRSAGPV